MPVPLLSRSRWAVAVCLRCSQMDLSVGFFWHFDFISASLKHELLLQLWMFCTQVTCHFSSWSSWLTITQECSYTQWWSRFDDFQENRSESFFGASMHEGSAHFACCLLFGVAWSLLLLVFLVSVLTQNQMGMLITDCCSVFEFRKIFFAASLRSQLIFGMRLFFAFLVFLVVRLPVHADFVFIVFLFLSSCWSGFKDLAGLCISQAVRRPSFTNTCWLFQREVLTDAELSVCRVCEVDSISCRGLWQAFFVVLIWKMQAYLKCAGL